MFRNHINYGHIIPIKINLGQDDLREIDVLRLIAKATHQSYKGWCLSWMPLKKLAWSVCFYGLLLLFISFFYFYQPTYNLFKITTYENGFTKFFPSQGVLMLKNDNEILSVCDDLDSILLNGQGVDIQDYQRILEEKINGKTLIINSTDTLKFSSHLKQNGEWLQLAIMADHFIYVNYRRIFVHVLKSKHWPDMSDPVDPSVGLKNDFPKFPPPLLDYWFISWLMLFIVLIEVFMRFSIRIGIRTHRYILSLLEELVSNLDANIVKEYSGNLVASEMRVPIISVKRSRQVPILDAKAIENQLVYVLNEIEKIPGITIRPRLVYIFDELDKIEPILNTAIKEKDEEYIKIEGSRMRQELIAKILANLKHFFNTAKAKFVFIAGREMYDAALADISDRESSISSIFHDVIYVNSFFTDDSDNRITDVTSMTEWYICQYLIPERYHGKYSPSLKGYHKFLEEVYFPKSATNNWKQDQMRQKIIITLHNFITYLAYRSNGAPKKLTSLFEDYVVKGDKKHLKNEHNITVGFNSEHLYLHFDYDAQYRIGFNTYLHTPFLMSVSPYIHELGDKLLVSTAYILDHMYKFHPYGFSWRNLEMTPEIVAINKAPHLRSFVTDLVDFLSGIHIRRISSGLHEFKFNRKLSSELQFISKISEPESAAFNFTLDESLQLKRLYRRRLAEAKKNYIGREGLYIHTIAYLQAMIGDLHFYDQEFDEAIMYYMDAVQPMRNMAALEIPPHQFIIFVRNMLKLGHSAERKKAYDSAYMNFSQVSSMVVGFREVVLDKFGIQEFIIKAEDLAPFVLKFHQQLKNIEQEFTTSQLDLKGEQSQKALAYFEENKFIFQVENSISVEQKSSQTDLIKKIFLKYMWDINNKRQKPFMRVIGRKSQNVVYRKRKKFFEENIGNVGRVETEHFTNEGLNEMDVFLGFPEEHFFGTIFPGLRFSPEKEKNQSKFSLQEGFRLLYQPIISRLHIAEKGNLGGIALSDIKHAEKEFEYLVMPIKSDEKYLVEAEFYNKLGDLFFYKNGYLFQAKKNSTQAQNGASFKSDFFDRRNLDFSIIASDKYYKGPYLAYEYYMKSIYRLTNNVIGCVSETHSTKSTLFNKADEYNCLIAIIKYFFHANKDVILNRSTTLLEELGSSMSDVADCLLALASGNCRIDFSLIKQVISCHENQLPDLDQEKYDNSSFLDQAFLFYWYSTKIFQIDSNYTRSNSQLLKIIHLINEIISVSDNKGNIDNNLILLIQKHIVERVHFKLSLRQPELSGFG